MNLVPDWKKSWRWFSIHALALQTAATLAWLQVPADLREVIPMEMQVAAAVGMFLLGWVGRIVDQPEKTA